jgi:hypothetical protein
MKMVTDFHSEDTIKTGLSHGLVLELTQKNCRTIVDTKDDFIIRQKRRHTHDP